MTKDKITADKLKSMGFKQIPTNNNTLVFMNANNIKINFENIDRSKIHYSNILCV